MGVRGLQTYLEQFCPDACYNVDIVKLIQEYCSKSQKKAEIVIDAQSCYNLWSKGIDWVTGFEIQKLIHKLKTFIDAFKSAGAELIFFFGGLTPEKKRDAWITRRTKNVREVLSVFDFLYAGNSSKDIPAQFNNIPPNMGLTASFILKYILKCKVYMTIEECDEEIVRYAYSHDSFAIFGQDTDFIISDLKSTVLSSKHFDLHSMTTKLYDRFKLARALNIQVSQLPMLAILAGNDIIHYDSIQDFHHTLCRSGFSKFVPFHILMPQLGKFINTLPHGDVEHLLRIISNQLFKSTEKLDLLKLAYDSYIIHPASSKPPPIDKWSQILKIARYRYINCIIPTVIWSVLSEQIFECSVAFEDLRQINDGNAEPFKQSSNTITRQLRQRLYGVLLNEHENASLFVTEWCAENVLSFREPVELKPTSPSVHHPGLLILWSDDNGNRLNNIRWTLFLTSVSPTIKDVKQWSQLEENILISTASLYYLFERKYLKKYEFIAILATLVTYPLFSREKLESLDYGKLDFRATQLSVTLIKTFGFVITLLAACGYPIPMSANIAHLKFEGKLFQIKYDQCIKQKMKINDLCENDSECIRTFYKMKNIICPEPFSSFRSCNKKQNYKNRESNVCLS